MKTLDEPKTCAWICCRFATEAHIVQIRRVVPSILRKYELCKTEHTHGLQLCAGCLVL